MEKTCKKCGETKDVSLFVKDKRKSIGIILTCKDCSKNRVKELKELNPHKSILYNKDYYQKNKKIIDLNNKEYYLKNREVIIKYKKEFGLKNNYAINKSKEYRNNNKLKIKSYKNNMYETITDVYAKAILRSKGFTKEQITTELIEVQRIIIKTKRL
jgi:transcription elongation factor Elf1